MKRLFLILPSVLILMAFAAPALAQQNSPAPSSCSNVLVDDAGVLGSRAGDVRQAAESLQNSVTGTTVRVLIAKNMNGNAAAYRQNVLNVQCKNDWGDGTGQAGDAHSRPDLLAVLISTADNPRQDDIYTGNKWAQINQAERNNIKSSILEANLRSVTATNTAPMADGIIRSLQKMQQDIAPSAAAKPQTGAAPAAAPKPAASAAAAPAQQSGPPFGAIFVFVLLAIGVIALLVWYIRKTRQESETSTSSVRTAQLQAKTARGDAIENVNSLDDKETSIEAKVARLTGVPDPTMAALNDQFTAAKGAAGDVQRRFATLNRPPNPDSDHLSVSEYNLMTSAWTRLNTDARSAHAMLDRIATLTDRLSRDPNASVDAAPSTPSGNGTAQPSEPTPIRPAPAPTPAPAPAPAAPSQAAYFGAAPPASNVGSNVAATDDAYRSARQEVLRAERFILDQSNLYYVRQSTWDGFNDAKAELSRADRASSVNSRQKHAVSAATQARDALSDAERDVRDRQDQRRNRWFHDYYGGYTPYAENSTLVVMPLDYGYSHERDYDAGYRAGSVNRGGGDSGGSWGNSGAETPSSGDSGGSWGGSGTGGDSGGSWGGSGTGGDSAGGWGGGDTGATSVPDSGSTSGFGGSDSGSTGGFDAGSTGGDGGGTW